MTILYIIIALVVIILLYVVGSYNSFVTLVNRTKEAWADIDVQLKRRYDLIPNLVNTIKGSTAFEQNTLTQVVEARAKATSIQIDPNKVNADTMKQLSASQGELSTALGKLMAISESYPDLKSNQNFLSLQTELSDTEDKIQAARRFYNGNVRDLNIAIERFPGNVIANTFHFSRMELFDLPDGDAAKNPVEVKF